MVEKQATGEKGPNDTLPSAVCAQRVTKVFGAGKNRVLALDDVSLTIQENEFFTLLGPSGCGKTTLLRLIAGFDQPTSGAIRLRGEELSRLPPHQRSVNTVFQDYALFPHMTVAKNISFGLEMMGKSHDLIKRTVLEMLALVKMEALRDRRPDQLSGGQQQRVALARALAPRPQVLLLDEPLSALDYKLRKEMQIELKQLQHDTGITFIFVTHDQEEALTMSDRMAVMHAGRILQIGTPRQIYNRPSERFVADFIGKSNFLSAEVLAVEGRRARLKLSSGRGVSATIPDGMRPDGRVTVVIRPEYTKIVSNADLVGDLRGVLENIVYLGTDTHYHIRLPDETMFVTRSQNQCNATEAFEPGQSVNVMFNPDSVQMLRS